MDRELTGKRRGTPAGVHARTGRRLLVPAAGIGHDWSTGAETERSPIVHSHWTWDSFT
ncbi:hypothetical protein L1856_09415 [Streptomyces sp. Tue 6430]|nr:hypothetical protein [Streptomyces sp. Tue 6430]